MEARVRAGSKLQKPHFKNKDIALRVLEEHHPGLKLDLSYLLDPP